MLDTVIQANDKIQFKITDFPGIILQKPVIITLKGTGPATVDGQMCCMDKDVPNFVEKAVPYTTANHPTPGTGDISIVDSSVTYTTNASDGEGQKFVLKGQQFTAWFTVVGPATNPGNPADPSHVAPGPIANAGTQFTIDESKIHIQMA
jgi:hypothetical protein